MPVRINNEQFFTAAEVASAAGIHRSTLWRWMSAGRVKGRRLVRNNSLLFTEDEMRQVIEFSKSTEPTDGTD